MRVFFDHNIPKRFRRFMAGHDVQTAREIGWAELGNGELLSAAENAGYDLMLTGDKNLQHQQNLQRRRLALVVLSTNDWNVLKLNSEQVVFAVHEATPGSFQHVTLPSRHSRSADEPPFDP